MRSFAFFVLALVVGLISCSKEESSNNPPHKIIGQISVDVDSANTSFNTGAVGDTAEGSGQYGVSIQGSTDTSSKADVILIEVGSLTPLVLGTYTQNSGNAGVDLVYTQKATNLSYSPNTSSNIAITFTALTDTLVTGTFSGTLFLHGDSTQGQKVFANGKFSVPTQ